MYMSMSQTIPMMTLLTGRTHSGKYPKPILPGQNALMRQVQDYTFGKCRITFVEGSRS